MCRGPRQQRVSLSAGTSPSVSGCAHTRRRVGAWQLRGPPAADWRCRLKTKSTLRLRRTRVSEAGLAQLHMGGPTWHVPRAVWLCLLFCHVFFSPVNKMASLLRATWARTPALAPELCPCSWGRSSDTGVTGRPRLPRPAESMSWAGGWGQGGPCLCAVQTTRWSLQAAVGAWGVLRHPHRPLAPVPRSFPEGPRRGVVFIGLRSVISGCDAPSLHRQFKTVPSGF